MFPTGKKANFFIFKCLSYNLHLCFVWHVLLGIFFASKLNSTDRFRKLKIHLGFFDHGMCYTQYSEELCFITIAQHSTWVSE